MIAYPITRAALEALIDQEAATWRNRAKQRTDGFKAVRRYQEASPIWSEVKRVYMRCQGEGKCVYCERKLEADLPGVEHDVEHFRPKGNVKPWTLPDGLAQAGVQVTAPPGGGTGYYVLPYNIFNYAASCKPCNEVLKADYFPIAGQYRIDGENPEDLAVEQPYLIYPLGDFDTPPEQLIRFHGVSPQPVAANGHDRLRALVTIEFFLLDSPTRSKSLIRERANLLVLLLSQLEKVQANAPGAAQAQTFVDALTSPKSSHTNCARCFVNLFQADAAKARALADAAMQLVISMS